MDQRNHDLSDDGHFLSDTDDEYNEDFEEWDELGNDNYQRKQKESELGKLDEQELLRLAAVNTESSNKTTKDNSLKNVELEQNRQAWLAVKGPIIGKRPGRKNAKAFAKEKKSPSKDAPKTKEETALEKLAFDEIVRETKRGKERAYEMGPAGWQKPKVPPTNKRFLQNTLLSTLPRKRRRDNKEKTVRQHSDENSEEYDHTEGIKPDVEEKIDEYRRKRSQNYEDEKFHRKLKAEEKKNVNKAAKQAEKDKKKFDNIMRYGVKIGAKKEKVTQENKKAIFDRYHGVWMQLDKTYGRSDSHSDDSEPSDDDRRSGKQRKYDRYDNSKNMPHDSGYSKDKDYYRHPMERKHAWQSYYAAAYNYYQYMQQHHRDRTYQERAYGYEVEPSGSSDKRYEHGSHYNDDRRYTDTDESDREHKDYKRKKRKKHKSKHKKKKGKKSEKKHKKSSGGSRTTYSYESERDGASGSPDYYQESKQQTCDKRFRNQDSDSADSDSDSELYAEGQETDQVLDSQHSSFPDLVDGEHKRNRKSNSQRDLTDVLSDGIYAKIMKEEKNLVAESNSSSQRKHKSVHNRRVKHKK